MTLADENDTEVLFPHGPEGGMLIRWKGGSRYWHGLGNQFGSGTAGLEGHPRLSCPGTGGSPGYQH